MRKQFKLTLALSIAIACLVHCTRNGVQADTAGFQALPLNAPAPAANPQSPQKIALGRLLFWDPILSGGKDVACASCHHPFSGYADGLDLAIGSNGVGTGTARHFALPNDIAFTRRNSATIINTAFNGIDVQGQVDPSTAPMFFDKRVQSLEAQSAEPIKTLEEMCGHYFTAAPSLDSVIKRLQHIPEYVQLFADAFGPGAPTTDKLAKALASFERTIIANHSPYDRYIRGDAAAMTAAQIRGMKAFQDNGCHQCHNGPMFSDYQLHVLSVPDNPKLPTDAGAGGTYAFRTPSLRNLSFTAPYMHSGVFASLGAVLNFYDQVGNGHAQNAHVGDSQLDRNLKQLNRGDISAILQFLQALDDDSFDKAIPLRVPSSLRVGGNL